MQWLLGELLCGWWIQARHSYFPEVTFKIFASCMIILDARLYWALRPAKCVLNMRVHFMCMVCSQHDCRDIEHSWWPWAEENVNGVIHHSGTPMIAGSQSLQNRCMKLIQMYKRSSKRQMNQQERFNFRVGSSRLVTSPATEELWAVPPLKVLLFINAYQSLGCLIML
jgi:hypothetical protein